MNGNNTKILYQQGNVNYLCPLLKHVLDILYTKTDYSLLNLGSGISFIFEKIANNKQQTRMYRYITATSIDTVFYRVQTIKY